MKIKQFVAAYIEAALWSSNDESTPSGGVPLDKNYSAADLAPETLAQMQADCEKFIQENAGYLEERAAKYGGHDFWLTRNGHGAGFWDGDWSDRAGEHLTNAAKKFGEVNLYVENGKIYA